MIAEPATALPAMSLAVVGVRHPNRDKSNRAFEILLCRPGDRIELRPEPKNKHDENAIAVFSERGVQIGYLTAERAPLIGRRMNQGHEVQAIFQLATPFGAWLRVAFDGEAPVLPPDRVLPPHEDAPPIEPEGGWFPDEVWDEDFG